MGKLRSGENAVAAFSPWRAPLTRDEIVEFLASFLEAVGGVLDELVDRLLALLLPDLLLGIQPLSPALARITARRRGEQKAGDDTERGCADADGEVFESVVLLCHSLLLHLKRNG